MRQRVGLTMIILAMVFECAMATPPPERWLTERAEAGDVWSMYLLGRAHIRSVRSKPLEPTTPPWLPEEALEQYEEYLQLRGAASFVGSLKTGLDWFERGAEAGHLRSMLIMGSRYRTGWDVERDLERARVLLSNAADGGNTQAMVELGYLLADDDPAAAARWYRRAAAAGDLDGQADLAEAMLRGAGLPADPEEALRLLESAANDGNAHALTILGSAYLGGDNVEMDGVRAFRYLLAGAEGGDARAMVNLGHCYVNGTGTESDPTAALPWYERAAAAGHGGGALGAAQLYRDGDGIVQDFVRAEQYFEFAIARGRSSAAVHLGRMLIDIGQGERGLAVFERAADEGVCRAFYELVFYLGGGPISVRDDPEQIRTWIERGAAIDCPDMLAYKGWFYFTGDGVEQDDEKAAALFHRAVEGGSGPGMNSVGLLYAEGRTVDADLAEAARWFKRAADARNSNGAFNLARAYEKGEGVEVDYDQAARHYERSWEYGGGIGLVGLGHLHAKGLGRPVDEARALQYYEHAANLYNGQAAYNIGDLYVNGKQTPQNIEVAIKWYEIAVKFEHHHALYVLGRIYYAGEGVEKDIDRGLELIQQAADHGEIEAMVALGAIYANWFDTRKGDRAQAIVWYTKAAEGGHVQSMRKLATLLTKGSTDEDNQAAVYWLEQAWAMGDVYAWKDLRTIYAKGRPGVPRDPERSRMMLIERAKSGHLPSIKTVAKGFRNGRDGFRRDHAQMIHWLTRGAELGDKDAAYDLGRHYEDQSPDGPDDPAQAAHWYERAATLQHESALNSFMQSVVRSPPDEHRDLQAYTTAQRQRDRLPGDRPACATIIWLIATGRVAEPDLALAFAAAQDLEAANSHLDAAAQVYIHGLGTDIDLERANQLLRDSVSRGNDFALLAYGDFLDRQVGDPALALGWYAMAADGSAQVRHRIDELAKTEMLGDLFDQLGNRADAGDGAAATALADVYSSGGMSPHAVRNRELSLVWRKRASELGDQRSAYILAQSLSSDRDLADDVKVRAYEYAARAGSVRAAGRLEELYRKEKLGLKKTDPAQLQWIRMQADAGSRAHCEKMGWACSTGGYGAEVDRAAGLRWLRLATTFGQESSTIKLARLLAQGEGAERDEGLELLTSLTESGSASAMFALGELLILDAETRDVGIAWLRQAAELGNRSAQRAVKKLEDSGESV